MFPVKQKSYYLIRHTIGFETNTCLALNWTCSCSCPFSTDGSTQRQTEGLTNDGPIEGPILEKTFRATMQSPLDSNIHNKISNLILYYAESVRPSVTIFPGRKVENRFCTVLYRFLHLSPNTGQAGRCILLSLICRCSFPSSFHSPKIYL